MKKIPNAIYWFFTSETLRDKNYLKAVDHIKENTEFDHMCVCMQGGVIREDYDQCHDMMAELVDYAHSRGVGISLVLSASHGFYNPGFDPNISQEKGQLELFTIAEPANAQGLVLESEFTLDAQGCATFEQHEYGARNKVRPLYNKLLKLYAFDKTAEGFYDPASLRDITSSARIIQCRTHMLEAQIDAGAENAGKTVYAMVAQYYNWPELFGASDWVERKALMDIYADIPMDGYAMDEYGYMMLNVSDVWSKALPPFRSRLYSPHQKAYYQEKLGIDLDRMLFDMRYAPACDDKVRIRAINNYFEHLRVPVLAEERRTAEYAKKLWGEEVYLGVHNTFHNHLDGDEMWHTACAWWDLPRRFGHTDEALSFPVRMGILLAAEDPLMIHTYYSNKEEDYYNRIVYDSPFNIRIFHHALDDFYWGLSYREPEFLKNIRILDKEIARLNDFQRVIPKMDTLIIFGYMALCNWYPDHEKRNLWDIDGSLEVEQKCNEIWQAGYRGALVPDYAISDGRVQIKDGKYVFNGHEFKRCLFLYPKYAKKEVYAFLNEAHAAKMPLCVVGKGEVDFNGEAAHLEAPVHEEYSLDLMEELGAEKLAIPNGCVYADGSFAMLHKEGLLEGKEVPFDFTLDGVRYTGVSTGLVAYRKGEEPILSEGSKIQIDN